jgi:hypothetical protein
VNEFNDRTERGGSDLEGDFNKVNFVGLFGVGMESDISSQLSFRFEPAFRYSFVSDVKDPVKEYFYSIGVNLVLLGNY